MGEMGLEAEHVKPNEFFTRSSNKKRISTLEITWMIQASGSAWLEAASRNTESTQNQQSRNPGFAGSGAA